MSGIRYKKDMYTIDVVCDKGNVRVLVDGIERKLYRRLQGNTGNVSFVVYVPSKGHNKQLTISKNIVEVVKEGISVVE